MISRLVALAVRLPFLVICAVALLVGGGIAAYRELDVEAYPNPVPPMIEVIAQPNGLSAEEVEKYVTVPLEIGLAGIPGLDHVRSQSIFGLSDLKCYFHWGADYEKVRQEVINRIGFVQLPNGVQAQLSPWSAIGEIYRYTLEGKGYSLSELKTAQDWVMERQLKQVPGVADVVSFGGETKEYHVSVDPTRLRGQNVTLVQLLAALQNANQNVGGQRLTLGEQSYDVRGVGLLRGTKDVENVVIATQGGTPVRVRDVADVEIGPAPRLGMIGKDGASDVVQGTVLMRYGAETPSTLQGIRDRVELIRSNRLLPPGMEIRPYYDRGDLVGTTMHTVTENLAIGMALVAAVLFVFLGDGRAALITAVTIPLALLAAFCGLVLSNTSANLISLGAIDFGIVVDSAVIMTENIFRHLGRHGKGTITERVLDAAKEVAGPMTFSTLIIGVSFLPLFTMTGVSGVIFAPMARTYAFAIGAAILLALTLAPVLATKLFRAEEEEKESRMMSALHRVYAPLFDFAVRRPWTSLVFGALPLLVALGAIPRLGKEFMPKLEEGNLWIRATLPVSISREQGARYADEMRAIIRGCAFEDPGCDRNRKHPEVLLAVSQLGRPDDGTDVTGFNDIEIFAPLAPSGQWPAGQTKETLVATMAQELDDRFPGAVFNFSQMISDNVEEAIAGVKGQNSVKVFGPDVDSNEKSADSIVTALDAVRGVEDLGLLRSSGQPEVRITPDREAAARYGLNSGDVLAMVQAAIGGQAATRVYEGDKSFDLTVRWKPEFRQSVTAIQAVQVATPGGAHIPLGQIAAVETVQGPAAIFREDGQRYTPIKFSVRGRDLAGAVQEAQRVASSVPIPYGSHLTWDGELNELRQAQARLLLTVPLALLLVGLLAYAAVKSGKDTLLVLSNIPVAGAGGILALLLTGTNLSVSAAMGFVSVFGIAVQDAILVVSYFQRLVADGQEVSAAAREAVEKRLRPVLMTALVAMLGLTPAALSHGIGSQTQRPLAIVVIGGAMMLLLASRVIQPALLVLVHRVRSPLREAIPLNVVPET